jgi:hypothetical protein
MWQRDVAVSCQFLGRVALDRNDTPTARRLYSEARSILEQELRRHSAQAGDSNVPHKQALQRDLAEVYRHLSQMAGSNAPADEPAQLLMESHRLCEALVNSQPSNYGWRLELAKSFIARGEWAATRHPSEARRLFFEAKQTLETLASADPGNTEYRHELTIALERIVDVALQAGDASSAKEFLVNMVEIRQELTTSEPGSVRWQTSALYAYQRLANFCLTTGEIEEGLKASRHVTAIASALKLRGAQIGHDLDAVLRTARQIELVAYGSSVGCYRIDMPIEAVTGLREFSPQEHAAVSQFEGEKNYDAPPVQFLRWQWDVMLGVVDSRVYQLSLTLEVHTPAEANAIVLATVRHYHEVLGAPDNRGSSKYYWDTAQGNILLNAKTVDGVFLISGNISSRRMLTFRRLSGPKRWPWRWLFR